MSKTKLFGIIGISVVVVFFTVYLLFFNKRNETVLNAMPNDVLCFFDINKANDFSILINQQEIYKALRQTTIIGDLHEEFNLYATFLSTNPELLSDLLNKRVVAGAFTTGNTDIDYLMLLQLDEAVRLNLKKFTPQLNGQQPEINTHTFERSLIYEATYGKSDTSFSFALERGIFIYSNNPVLVENAILQLKKGNPVSENDAFKDVYDQIDRDNNNFTLYLNTPQLTEYLSMFSTNDKYNDIIKMQNYVSWIGLQPQVKPNGLTLNGYASAKGDKEKLKLAEFSGQFATAMHSAVPGNTAVLYRINSSQLTENFAGNLKDEKMNRDFFDYWSPWMGESLLVGLSESFDGNFGKRAFVIIPANDIKLAQNKLSYAVISDTLKYKGVKITTLSCNEMIKQLTGAGVNSLCYSFWENNALVLAFDYLQLTNMIDAIESKQNLNDQDAYTTFKEEVSATFNTSVYLDLAKNEQIIKSFISDKYKTAVEGNFNLLQQFSQLELQFTQNKDVYIVNGFIKFEATPQRNSGSLWKLNLDAPIQSGPFCVLNSGTGQQCVMVQDTLHQLIQISLSGDVQWKLNLGDKIISDIKEVDFYGNSITQYLFNTQNAIYLLNANGESVEGFPITLTTKITNPIAVIDHNNSGYKMFVACENGNIYGYFKDGKPISGWSPLKGAGKVEESLFLVEGQNKTLIGFINERGLQLKKENGNNHETISMPSIFADRWSGENQTGIVDMGGNIIVIDSMLKINRFDGEPGWKNPILADINDDNLIDLLFLEDNYFKAQTVGGENLFVAECPVDVNKLIQFNDNGMAYFGLVTLTNRIYLYDNNGKIIDGFPIDGSENTMIRTISTSGDKMLITTVGGSVMAYRIL